MSVIELPARTLAGHELQHPAYRCTARDLWPTDLDELSDSHKEDLDRYLADFARPIRNIANEMSCVGCGSLLTARTEATAKSLGKTVEFDEESGEGRCLGCGYPLRTFHQMFSREGRLLVRLEGFPLLYHPNSTKRTS